MIGMEVREEFVVTISPRKPSPKKSSSGSTDGTVGTRSSATPSLLCNASTMTESIGGGSSIIELKERMKDNLELIREKASVSLFCYIWSLLFEIFG